MRARDIVREGERERDRKGGREGKRERVREREGKREGDREREKRKERGGRETGREKRREREGEEGEKERKKDGKEGRKQASSLQCRNGTGKRDSGERNATEQPKVNQYFLGPGPGKNQSSSCWPVPSDRQPEHPHTLAREHCLVVLSPRASG